MHLYLLHLIIKSFSMVTYIHSSFNSMLEITLYLVWQYSPNMKEA